MLPQKQDRSSWPQAVQSLVASAEAAATQAANAEARQAAEAAEAALEAELETLRAEQTAALQDVATASRARWVAESGCTGGAAARGTCAILLSQQWAQRDGHRVTRPEMPASL